jgi:hypothetical protein
MAMVAPLGIPPRSIVAMVPAVPGLGGADMPSGQGGTPYSLTSGAWGASHVMPKSSPKSDLRLVSIAARPKTRHIPGALGIPKVRQSVLPIARCVGFSLKHRRRATQDAEYILELIKSHFLL